MVALQEDAVRATGKAARAIALAQRSLQRSRDRAPLAANRQRYALVVLDDLHDPRVTAQPACGFAGHERLAQLADLDRVKSRTGTKAARRNREHHLDRGTLRPV